MLTTKVNTLSALDLTKTSLHFEHPNTEMFPCLNLAKKAYKEKKCIELNAANEIAVELFLEDKISFTQIPEIVKHTMETASPMSISVDIPYTDVLTYIEDRDEKARIFAYTLACL